MIAEENCLANTRLVFQPKLDEARVDIGAVRAVEHIFLAANDFERAVRFQRAEITLTNVSVNGGEVLMPPEKPQAYCYGAAPVEKGKATVTAECPEQYDGRHFRQARITVVP